MTSSMLTPNGASNIASIGRRGPVPSAENKRVVERIWSDLVNAGRLETLDELVSSRFIEHCPLPGLTSDLAGLRSRLEMLHRAFPDFHSEIRHLMAEGDMAIAFVESSGTHLGTFLGLPASGRRFTLLESQLMRIVDGKMVEHWQVANFYSLMQQLGFAGPSPAGF